MKFLFAILLLFSSFSQAEMLKGTMEVISTDVPAAFGGANVYDPGTPAQITSAQTTATITENGGLANVNATTTYTTTPGRAAQMVPIPMNLAPSFRVIVNGQRLLLNCSWAHRCMRLEPGFFQTAYALKKGVWKDIWIYGNDVATGKAMKLKYSVVSEW